MKKENETSKTKEPQKFSVKPYKEWKKELPEGAQFGILSKLHETQGNRIKKSTFSM
jgi:hypothetical protein